MKAKWRLSLNSVVVVFIFKNSLTVHWVQLRPVFLHTPFGFYSTWQVFHVFLYFYASFVLFTSYVDELLLLFCYAWGAFPPSRWSYLVKTLCSWKLIQVCKIIIEIISIYCRNTAHHYNQQSGIGSYMYMSLQIPSTCNWPYNRIPCCKGLQSTDIYWLVIHFIYHCCIVTIDHSLWPLLIVPLYKEQEMENLLGSIKLLHSFVHVFLCLCSYGVTFVLPSDFSSWLSNISEAIQSWIVDAYSLY